MFDIGLPRMIMSASFEINVSGIYISLWATAVTSCPKKLELVQLNKPGNSMVLSESKVGVVGMVPQNVTWK